MWSCVINQGNHGRKNHPRWYHQIFNGFIEVVPRRWWWKRRSEFWNHICMVMEKRNRIESTHVSSSTIWICHMRVSERKTKHLPYFSFTTGAKTTNGDDLRCGRFGIMRRGIWWRGLGVAVGEGWGRLKEKGGCRGDRRVVSKLKCFCQTEGFGL